MKKLILFSLGCLLTFSFTFATSENEGARGPINTKFSNSYDNTYIPEGGMNVIYEENFNGDNTPTGLAARSWIFLNEDGGGTTTTFDGNSTVFPAFEGPAAGYVGQNFNGANGFLINQWLISPQFTVQAGDTVSFWWRAGGGQWDDSVYLKISNGGSNISDFTTTIGRFRVPDGSWVRYTYVFTTGGAKRFAFQYYHTDGGTNGNHSNYWGLDLFQVISGSAPAGPGVTTNPNPAHNATGVALSTTVTWSNPTGTTGNEVFFGTSAGNMTSVYTGAAKTSHQLPTLSYGTTYFWRVNASDASGTTIGNVWSFTTIPDPNNPLVFLQDFEAATFPPAGWVIETTGATPRWTRQTTASGYGIGTAAARMDYYLASTGQVHSMITQTFPAVVDGKLQFDHAYATYTGNESDRLDIETSTNGGTTWSILVTYEGGNSNPLSTAPGQSGAFVPTAAQWGTKMLNLPAGTNRIRFKATSAFGNNLWLDNITLNDLVPVELTSFAATTVSRDVVLSWTTASETNNQGFEVERKSTQGEFEKIGFVAGSGTTTELQTYGYVDAGLSSGTYSYRLKQIDFDGTFEYSNVVEIEVALPTEYSLEQNFPNPFNPTTTIQFSLAEASFVTLKIFNVLGEEVATLLNNEIAQGIHEVNFNASNFNSGIYFYQISAKGNDGSNFTSVKKMILNK